MKMANEVRLIDANALIEDITAAEENAGMGAVVAGTLRRYVNRRPTIDPESLRAKGRWAAINADCRGYANAFECSNCETISHTHTYMKECDFDFCPVCGAKMEG